MSRSDWQLAEGDRVMYVVGRYPIACSTGRATISVIADVDTITVGATRRPRQYLVIPR
jgi:hypothetical protein